MKRINLIIVLLLLFSPASLAQAPAKAEAAAEPGGWQNITHEAAELPTDAQAVFDKAVESLVGAEYTPVALLSTRADAGMHYCILCQIMPEVPDAATSWVLMYIHADPEGNTEITNLYELYIDRHSTPQ